MLARASLGEAGLGPRAELEAGEVARCWSYQVGACRKQGLGTHW